MALDLPKIQNGALFIADSHDNANKKAFLHFLRLLQNGGIAMPPQLFLMGDMFDLLANTTYSQRFFHEYIELLNYLSKKTQIYYFEGNHDFNLGDIFPDITFVPISAQPLKFELAGKVAALAHGDIFLGFIDTLALRFIRSKSFLFVINFFDRIFKFEISKRILNYEAGKKLDYKIPNFKEKVAAKLGKYEADIIIEGHYHQGVQFKFESKFYLNLPSFACERSYFVVKYLTEKEIEFQIIRSPNV